MIVLAVDPISIPSDWIQYGSFGLISAIVLYTLLWVGPQVIQAIRSIGPTVVHYLEEQEERHMKWMREMEDRHTRERSEHRQMIATFLSERPSHRE
jgi:predicted PurR-regulated permease PerM